MKRSGNIEIRAGVQDLLRRLAELGPIRDQEAAEIVTSMKRSFTWIEQNMDAASPDEKFQRRQLEHARSEWQNLMALRAAPKLKRAPRGLSKLYREADKVLEREGADYSTSDVRLALKAAGVVTSIDSDAKVLHWIADNGAPKRTTFKQFDTGLSRHRARLRKK